MEVREVSTEEGVRSVYPVVRQLRTHLDEEEWFVAAVGRMRPEGYQLVAAYDDGGRQPGWGGGFPRLRDASVREDPVRRRPCGRREHSLSAVLFVDSRMLPCSRRHGPES